MQDGIVLELNMQFERQWPASAATISYMFSVWWRGEDSNLRRLRRQIYSLLPLATREPLPI